MTEISSSKYYISIITLNQSYKMTEISSSKYYISIITSD